MTDRPTTTDRTASTERLPSPLPERIARVARAAFVGAASGGRSTAGLAALAWTSSVADRGPAATLASTTGRLSSTAAVVGECIADLLPATPTRTRPPGLVPRILLAQIAAVGVGLRNERDPDIWNVAEAFTAAAAAIGAAFGAARVRTLLADRLRSDLPGALLEDLAVAGLAWLGSRQPSR